MREDAYSMWFYSLERAPLATLSQIIAVGKVGLAFCHGNTHPDDFIPAGQGRHFTLCIEHPWARSF